MKLISFFAKQVTNRDFNPKRVQKTCLQYLFQCKLHIYGSRIILFLLCLFAFISLGIYQGTQMYLKQMEEDPFSSAITLQVGMHYSYNKLSIIKERFRFNKETQDIEINPKSDAIPIINEILPYNENYLFFIDKNCKLLLGEEFNVVSFKLDCFNNNNWLKKYLSSGSFFSDYDNDNTSDSKIIVSKMLYQKMGFTDLKKIPNNPIFFSKADLVDERKGDMKSPLTDMEKKIFVHNLDLINISDRLPFDSIISEQMYYLLFNYESKYYKPCKTFELFYIYFNGQKIEQKILKDWANKYFGYSHDLVPLDNGVKIRLKQTDHEMAKRCNIIKWFQELSNTYKFLTLDLSKSDEPNQIPDDIDYSYSFLFLNSEPVIIDNIEIISRKLKRTLGCFIDDSQPITLKKLRKNSKMLKKLSIIVVSSILISLLFYIFMTFSLFIQTRIHMIGMMKSMGAKSRSIKWIYIYESLKLISPSIIIASIIAVAIQENNYLLMTDIVYLFDYLSWFICVMIILLTTCLGAWLAGRHVVSRSPYELLSYHI